MIRLLIVGLVAVSAALGGVYAGTLLGAPTGPSTPVVAAEPVEIIKLESVSVPIIRKGAVDGYVIAHVSITAIAAEVKKNRASLLLYAGAASFRAIYEEEGLDFAALKSIQLSALSERITKLASDEMGNSSIKKTTIESLSFVSRSEIRMR